MGNENETAERLVKLETKLETIETSLRRLEAKLDAREEKFVTRDVLNEILRSRDERSLSLQKAIYEIKDEKKENKKVLPDWINAFIALTALAIALFFKQ
jgi:predicted  nucleic acid-binding Zn-ribbon protein